MEEQERSETAAGLNLTSGEPFLPAAEGFLTYILEEEEEIIFNPYNSGVWDSLSVKRQALNLATVLATQLLLVDEVMKAGKAMGKQPAAAEEE